VEGLMNVFDEIFESNEREGKEREEMKETIEDHTIHLTVSESSLWRTETTINPFVGL